MQIFAVPLRSGDVLFHVFDDFDAGVIDQNELGKILSEMGLTAGMPAEPVRPEESSSMDRSACDTAATEKHTASDRGFRKWIIPGVILLVIIALGAGIFLSTGRQKPQDPADTKNSEETKSDQENIVSVESTQESSETPEITSEASSERTSKTTDYRYTLSEDHAEINYYDRDLEVLDIPSEIEGLPVTVIQYESASGATDTRPNLREVILPETITEIGAYTFSNCPKLEEIKIPDSVTEIGGCAFYNCTALSSLDLPEGLTEIGIAAFSECKSLQEISIPDGVQRIRTSTFQGCTGLTSVALGAGTVIIDDYAFCLCTGLRRISLPSSITRIGQQAFSYCLLLGKVEYDGDRNQWSEIDIDSGNEQLVSAAIQFAGTETEEKQAEADEDSGLPGTWSGLWADFIVITITLNEDGTYVNSNSLYPDEQFTGTWMLMDNYLVFDGNTESGYYLYDGESLSASYEEGDVILLKEPS